MTYNTDIKEIKIYRGDTVTISLLFKDQNGNIFTPNPAYIYKFAVKQKIDDTAYFIEPVEMTIVGNYLKITLSPKTIGTGFWEVVEINDDKQFTLKSNGFFEVLKDIII